ncbi:ribosylnicotinamide kinase [Xylographa trunciseda]|nr:ribosylnicotinamide kinase [Xylographa trunciseda]
MDSGIDGLFGLRVPQPRTTSCSPSRGRAEKRSVSLSPNLEAGSESRTKDLANLTTAPAPVGDLANSEKVAAKSKSSQAVVNPICKSAMKTRKEMIKGTSGVSTDPLLAKEGRSSSTLRGANPEALEVPQRKPSSVWIGISGAPASGKTTLAHLLSFIMPSSTKVVIIHQDDYQKPRHLLVPGDPADLEQDGEHDQSVDTNGFLRLCCYVNRNGTFPRTFRTQHHDVAERAAALALIHTAHVEDLQALVFRSNGFESVSVVIIVEGPFLYNDPDLYDALDVRLFLRASRSIARSRQLSQMKHLSPNMNNDLFWLSPDYFDRVIWRMYLQEYSLIFPEDAADEAELTVSHMNREIQLQDELDVQIIDTLRWATAIFLWDLPHSLVLSRSRRLEHKSFSSRRNLLTWLARIRDTIYYAI